MQRFIARVVIALLIAAALSPLALAFWLGRVSVSHWPVTAQNCMPAAA